MKAFLFSLALAASAATGYAQTSVSVTTTTATIAGATTEPQKGTNTILIQTSDSVGIALKKIARAMVMKGYSVKTLDKDLGYVVTEPRNVGGGITTNSTAFVFKAVAEPVAGGTLLTLVGDAEIVYAGTNRMTEPMFWAKSNLTWGKQCFSVAQEIAQGYTGAVVGYRNASR